MRRDPFGDAEQDSTTMRGKWDDITLAISLMEHKFNVEPSTVSQSEVYKLKNSIKIQNFSSVTTYGEIRDALERLSTLEMRLANYRSRSVPAATSGMRYDSKYFTFEDVYDCISDVFGKIITFILWIFTLLWAGVMRLFGRAYSVIPEYPYNTTQRVKRTIGYNSVPFTMGQDAPQLQDQEYLNNFAPEYAMPYSSQPSDLDGSDSTEVIDGNNFGHLKYRSASQHKDSYGFNKSGGWNSKTYYGSSSSSSSSGSSFYREDENATKRKLKNFGLVNSAGVNACFLNSLVQALGCVHSFVSRVSTHEAQHSKSGRVDDCIVCIVSRIFSEIKVGSSSVEDLRKALGLEENRPEDPFEIFEKIFNRLPVDVREVFNFTISDRSNPENAVTVGMFDMDFVKFFSNDFDDSLGIFAGVLSRPMASPFISSIEDTLAVYLDTYGPVSIADHSAVLGELCRNPSGRILWGERFTLVSFICSQMCGSVAHYITFYYIPSERKWAYCNDLTVETCSPDLCASKVLDCNFYPKLLFFKKD